MAKLEGSVLGFLNLDDDERLVPKGDYVDALNIRKTISSGGVPSPAYNVLGNTLVNYSLPAGENTCVGAIVHEETNNLFYFVHNTLSDHSILQYNTITGNITLVAQDRFLNLKKNAFVTGQAINAIDDSGVLLYFTDNINPPRKINVKRAILHQQGDYTSGYAQEFSSGTDAQKAQFYDYIKHPPSEAPTFEFFTDNNRSYNNLREDVRQFRYRYIYDDGEVSALSPYSEVAISNEQLQNNANVANEYSTNNNGLRVTVNTSLNNVEKIEITFRNGNDGDEFILTRIDNTPENSTTTVDFYNDGTYSLLNTGDATKNNDGVPLLAKDMKLKEKRMFLANVLDGYDNVDVSGNVGVSYSPSSDLSSTQTIDVSILPAGNNIEIDFSNVTTWEPGYTISLSFNITVTDVQNRLIGVPTVTSYNVNYKDSYIVGVGDTKSDFIDYFLENINDYQSSSIYLQVTNRTTNALTFRIRKKDTNEILGISTVTTFPSTLVNKSGVYEFGLAENSFKAGASHPIGIQYLDQAGRPVGTVSRLASTYVKWYTERNGGSEGYGSTSLGVMLDNTPPISATHYQIVHAGNSSIDEFLEYTTVGAYKVPSSSSNDDDRLYLSFRNFKGESKSFRDSTGALPDYQFVEGDRLRIKSYWDYTLSTPQRVIPNGYLDFKIVGFELLAKDADTNPIYNNSSATTQEQTSGYFLILENPKIEGFDTEEARSADSGSPKNNFWYDYTAEEGAYFEIYRPKAQTEFKSYYEIGEKYAIANPGTASRYHEGGVRNQNESVSVSAIPPETADDFFNYVDADTSTNKFVAGDIIQCTNSGGLLLGIFSITRVLDQSTYIRLYIDGALSNNDATAVSTITLQSEGAATSVAKGDVWYKPRAFFEGNVNALSASFAITNQWVEDYYANDFIDSDSWDKGRVWAFSPDNKQLRRKSSVYHSEPFFSDTNFNGLSTIYLSQTPFFDYDQSFGSIQAIRSHNDGLVLWKENKVSLAPVDRRIIESTDGGQISTTSDTVLGEERFYAGDYGIGLNPESLSGGDGRWYWLDPKRGKFLRLSNDGITPVSDYKMRSYFYRETKLYQQNYGGAKFFGGYDRENEEAIITFPQVTSGAIVVTPSQTPVISPLPNSTEVSGNIYTTVDIQQGTPKTRTWSSETRTWAEIDETWDQWGGAEYDTSEIAERGIVEVPADKISNSAEPIYVTYKTATGDVVARGTLNIDESRIEVPTTGTDPAHPIAVTTTTAGTAECVAFYEPANRWSTFYSFTPEMFAVISNIFVSWKDGALYVHNGNTTRNNFYGVQYNSEISPIVNDAPYDAKMFFAAGLESTTTWDAVFTTDLNTASADETRWVDKEGTYYTDIPMCYSGTTVSNIIGLSDVVDVTGNNVEVARYTTNGLFVGDVVYNSGTSIGTITAIDSDTNILTLTSSGSLSSGDYVYVQRNLQIEGDRLRGVYCRIDLTSDDTTETELYKIDLEAKKSYI